MGMAVRIYGIDFGLPYSYHDDEDRLVHHALAFGMGDLNPHYFNYPSFLMYLLFAVYSGFYVFARVFGIVASAFDFSLMFFTDPTPFYIIGRTITVLFGTATLFLVYLIGKRLYSRTAGLVAALIMAVMPVHALSSHYITTDVPMTFFVTAAAYFSVRILEEGRAKHYILAAVMTGLAAGSKYNGVLAAVFILAAHVVRMKGLRSRVRSLIEKKLVLAGLIVVITFFVVSPFCFLDFNTFVKDLRFDSLHVRKGVYGTSSGVTWARYAGVLFTDELYSWPHPLINPAGVLLLSGIVYALYRRGQKEAVVGLFPLVFFAVIGSWSVVNRKYILPLLPSCAVFSGMLFAGLCGGVSRQRLRRTAAWVCLILLLAVPFRNCVLNAYVMSREDTRTMARKWIEENIPEGTLIALEWDTNETVPLDESRQSIEEKIEAYEKGDKTTIHFPNEHMVRIHKTRLHAGRGKGYAIVRIGKVEGIKLIPHLYDIEELRNREVEYVVVSEDVAMTFRSATGNQDYPVHAKFYRDLEREAVLINTFKPEKGRTPGPVISVYSLNTDAVTSLKGVH